MSAEAPPDWHGTIKGEDRATIGRAITEIADRECKTAKLCWECGHRNYESVLTRAVRLTRLAKEIAPDA